jgi:hypothetical protein
MNERVSDSALFTAVSGDEVWVISGAHVPNLLRPPAAETYTLVEECYVHGLRRGDMLNNEYELKDQM